MKKRKTMQCPRCKHKFKNFKWSWDYYYDYSAKCPKCKLAAWKFEKLAKALLFGTCEFRITTQNQNK